MEIRTTIILIDKPESLPFRELNQTSFESHKTLSVQNWHEIFKKSTNILGWPI